MRSYAVLAFASGMHAFKPPLLLRLEFRKDTDTTVLIIQELRQLANDNLRIWSALEIVYSAALPVLPHHGLFHTRETHLGDAAISVLRQRVVIDASAHDIPAFHVIKASNLVVLDVSNSQNFTSEDMGILTTTGRPPQLQVLLVRNCTRIGESALWRASEKFPRLRSIGQPLPPQLCSSYLIRHVT